MDIPFLHLTLSPPINIWTFRLYTPAHSVFADIRLPYALMPYGEREISFTDISSGADYLTLGDRASLQLHTAALLGGVCLAVRLRGVKCRPCRHLLHQLAVIATEPRGDVDLDRDQLVPSPGIIDGG